MTTDPTDRTGEDSNLAIMGLTTLQEAVLWHVTEQSEVSVAALAVHLGVHHADLEPAVAALASSGVIGVSRTGTVSSVPLDLVLGTRLRRREEELDRARQALRALSTLRQSSTNPADDGPVTVIRGRAAIREQLRHLQDGARSDVSWLCRPGSVVMESADNGEELEALARGVGYRVVYDRVLLEERGMLDDLERGMRAGERARSAERVPVRLAIADRALAICPLVPPDATTTEPTAALVRSGALLDALLALFEHEWERAVPLHTVEDADHRLAPPGYDAGLRAAPGPAAHLSDADRQLLSLLAAGLPDKAIASSLGVSVRTVRRRVAGLLQGTDCGTRIELVWKGARNGWI